MRVTLAGNRNTSRTTVFHRLTELPRDKLMLVLHHHEPLHEDALAWGQGRCPVYVIGPDRLISKYGPVATRRLAWDTLFRVHRPDVLLWFGKEDNVEPLIEGMAKTYGVPIVPKTAIYGKNKPTEECGVLSPTGTNRCNKHLNHPGGYHAEYETKGGVKRRRSSWRDRDSLRRAEASQHDSGRRRVSE